MLDTFIVFILAPALAVGDSSGRLKLLRFPAVEAVDPVAAAAEANAAAAAAAGEGVGAKLANRFSKMIGGKRDGARSRGLFGGSSSSSGVVVDVAGCLGRELEEGGSGMVEYGAHGGPIALVRFGGSDDQFLISVGSKDGAIIQWQHEVRRPFGFVFFYYVNLVSIFGVFL